MLLTLSVMAAEVVITAISAAKVNLHSKSFPWFVITHQTDGLVQERRNSIAKAMQLRLSFTYPLKYIAIP